VARARVTARFIGDASIDRNGFTGSGAMREKKHHLDESSVPSM
jgi:hypothetical protein